MQTMFTATLFRKTGALFTICALSAMLFHGRSATAQGSVKPARNTNKLIYVENFRLDPGAAQTQDDEAEVHKLIDLMAASLVKELNKAGYQAKRLQPDELAPHDGLLLGGVFTELDKGNRAKRALIGFGSGAAKIEVAVRITDLSKTHQETMYSASARKTSGKAPGAVVMPSLTPVKLILTKQSPERTVKKTAAKIVARLAGELG